MRVTISGIFASEDMEELDTAMIEFVARHGQVRGIFDYTEVEAFAVPDSRLAQRAQQPSAIRSGWSWPRASGGGEGARTYGRYQRDAGQKEAAIVGSLDEAYALLGLRNPRFEPVER